MKFPSLATVLRGLGLHAKLVTAVEEIQHMLRLGGGMMPGDKMGAWVSRRDLVEWGFATQPGGGGGQPGGGPIAPNLPGFDPEVPDYTPPPKPENLTAVGGYTSIFVKWDALLDRRIGFFEVWRAAVDDIGEAVKVGQTTSFQYVDDVQNSDTYFYWARSVNKWDTNIVSPFNAVAGTEAQTAPDVGLALEVLTGDGPDKPFYVVEEDTTIDGIPIQAGVYLKAAFALTAVAETMIAGYALIDDANIKDLYASKLIGDKLAVGQWISSQNYVGNTSGWRINADGSAEFSDVTARGTIYATSGAIGGIVITPTSLSSANYISSGGAAGFSMSTDGSARFNNVTVRGDVQASSVAASVSISSPVITGGSVTGTSFSGGTFSGGVFYGGAHSAAYQWPVAGGTGGFHLSASGLLLGNMNGGTAGYAEIRATGDAFFNNIYARGDIEAQSLKAGVAMVDTLHIGEWKVTQPVMATGADEIQMPHTGATGQPTLVIANTFGLGPAAGDDGTVYLLLEYWNNFEWVFLRRAVTVVGAGQDYGITAMTATSGLGPVTYRARVIGGSAPSTVLFALEAKR